MLVNSFSENVNSFQKSSLRVFFLLFRQVREITKQDRRFSQHTHLQVVESCSLIVCFYAEKGIKSRQSSGLR